MLGSRIATFTSMIPWVNQPVRQFQVVSAEFVRPGEEQVLPVAGDCAAGLVLTEKPFNTDQGGQFSSREFYQTRITASERSRLTTRSISSSERPH